MKKILFVSCCFVALNSCWNICCSQTSSEYEYTFTANARAEQDHFRNLKEDCFYRRMLMQSATLTEDSLQRHRVTLGKKETELLYLQNREIIKLGDVSQELRGLFDNQRDAVKKIRSLKGLLSDPGLLSDQRKTLEDQKAQVYAQALHWGTLFYTKSIKS